MTRYANEQFPRDQARRAAKCQRPDDCRCWLPIEGTVTCPRPPECVCRYTYACTWEKGDDHAACRVHNPSGWLRAARGEHKPNLLPDESTEETRPG